MCEGSRWRRGVLDRQKISVRTEPLNAMDHAAGLGSATGYSSNFTLLVVLPATWTCHNISVEIREKINASEISA